MINIEQTNNVTGFVLFCGDASAEPLNFVSESISDGYFYYSYPLNIFYLPVGLDSEKSIFSEKMRKEGERGEKIGKRGKIDVVRAYKGRF